MFSMEIRPEVLKRLREEYPVGCTVELIEMCDPYRNMPAGMTSKVTLVDDAGGVHVDWNRAKKQGCYESRPVLFAYSAFVSQTI